jgi:hypothetical protein
VTVLKVLLQQHPLSDIQGSHLLEAALSKNNVSVARFLLESQLLTRQEIGSCVKSAMLSDVPIALQCIRAINVSFGEAPLIRIVRVHSGHVHSSFLTSSSLQAVDNDRAEIVQELVDRCEPQARASLVAVGISAAYVLADPTARFFHFGPLIVVRDADWQGDSRCRGSVACLLRNLPAADAVVCHSQIRLARDKAAAPAPAPAPARAAPAVPAAAAAAAAATRTSALQAKLSSLLSAVVAPGPSRLPPRSGVVLTLRQLARPAPLLLLLAVPPRRLPRRLPRPLRVLATSATRPLSRACG